MNRAMRRGNAMMVRAKVGSRAPLGLAFMQKRQGYPAEAVGERAGGGKGQAQARDALGRFLGAVAAPAGRKGGVHG